jgi:hypothetical protein
MDILYGGLEGSYFLNETFGLLFNLFPVVTKLKDVLDNLAGHVDDADNAGRINHDDTSDAFVRVYSNIAEQYLRGSDDKGCLQRD